MPFPLMPLSAGSRTSIYTDIIRVTVYVYLYLKAIIYSTSKKFYVTDNNNIYIYSMLNKRANDQNCNNPPLYGKLNIVNNK